jgi:hypothetical protein
MARFAPANHRRNHHKHTRWQPISWKCIATWISYGIALAFPECSRCLHDMTTRPELFPVVSPVEHQRYENLTICSLTGA